MPPKTKRVNNTVAEIYRVLDAVADLPILLRVFYMDGDHVLLEAVDKDGDPIDETCPLLELAPDGTLTEQGLDRDERDPVEILRDAINRASLTKQINVRVSPKELTDLKRRAKESGMSVSQLIRQRVV